MTRFRSRSLWVSLAGAALVVLALAAAGPIARAVVGSRVRALAASRGLAVGWEALAVGPAPEAAFRELTVTRRADGDTVLRVGSLEVGLDPWSLLLLHARPVRVVVAHARARITLPRGADADSLAEEEPPAPGSRPGDRERAERLRGTARSLVRLLAAPARQLPHLSLSDIVFAAGPRGEDPEPGAGLRLAWLDLSPSTHGVRLAATGALLGERDVPFAASFVYEHDDRLTGEVRFDIHSAAGARAEPLHITVDGALTQERRLGRVLLADSTRVTLGAVRFRLGGSLERAGPRVRLVAEADTLTAAQWRASLPPAVLGPLSSLTIRGWYAQRLSLDLDLERPDSVAFSAVVTPHGLSIDPAATRLDLLDLNQPFTAHIHLPHDVIVERDLSRANPWYSPLDDIDSLLVNAVVTNEDGAFFRHRGFNTEAVRGAIAANAKAGSYRRGAGTITMQLARNLYLGHARTLARKTQEVVLAWVLEHLTGLSKQRMLEIYLNIIEWGPGIHGADEAAVYYFGHDAERLTVGEALFLATVIPAPTKWRNRLNPDGTLRPFERAQMHFIGRAMIARGRLAPELLPPADSLRIELRGPALDVLFPPKEAHADTTPS